MLFGCSCPVEWVCLCLFCVSEIAHNLPGKVLKPCGVTTYSWYTKYSANYVSRGFVHRVQRHTTIESRSCIFGFMVHTRKQQGQMRQKLQIHVHVCMFTIVAVGPAESQLTTSAHANSIAAHHGRSVSFQNIDTQSRLNITKS